MPEYWHSIRDNYIEDDDDEEVRKQKKFNMSIAAARKPYFMTYVYPKLRAQNRNYIKDNEFDLVRKFGSKEVSDIEEICKQRDDNEELDTFLMYYKTNIPVGNNPCVVNRICWLFENTFDGYLSKRYEQPEFDYEILKNGGDYSRADYCKVLNIYNEYKSSLEAFTIKAKTEKVDKVDIWIKRQLLLYRFKRECAIACTNEKELCDIVLDICYKSDKTKQFAWDICGDTILDNLLQKNNMKIHFPQYTDEDGDFEYCGENFRMTEKKVDSAYDNFE